MDHFVDVEGCKLLNLLVEVRDRVLLDGARDVLLAVSEQLLHVDGRRANVLRLHQVSYLHHWLLVLVLEAGRMRGAGSLLLG